MRFSLFRIGIPLCWLSFFMLPLCSWGQAMEVTNNPPITPENLITNVFLGEGVEVIDVQFEGASGAVGFFKNGSQTLGIERGLVMTTGRAVTEGSLAGVDAFGSAFANNSSLSPAADPDINIIANDPVIKDVCKYTIRFIPIADTLRFRYVFASEEYPEYACTEFNDVFGFFISGPGFNGPYENGGENIALIPGTSLPVTINNVNPGAPGSAGGDIKNCTPPNGSLSFSQFYHDNSGVQAPPVYDGFTSVFVAEAIVTPCREYTIKLVIADVGDDRFDSGVFLEAKSFGTGTLSVNTTTLSLDGNIAEGCAAGQIRFSLPRIVETDFPIEYQLLGTARNGVDYQYIPENLAIPAGSNSLTIPIIALEDGLSEGMESIIFDVQRDICNRDTFTIYIRDNELAPPDLPGQTAFCRGDSTILLGTLPVALPPPPHFESSAEVAIAEGKKEYYSDILVTGVVPPVLGPEVLRSVCIDSLTHRWIDDLDIYLIGPDGQFLELTTDNGQDGGNGLGIDQYLHTCFTPTAVEMISAPGPFAPASRVPFTGEFLPEGVWSDFWDGEKQTNGPWRLLVFDDVTGSQGVGTLHKWSISFNSAYSINYQWTPAAGLSCADCPDPMAFPDQTTTYQLMATDSYGCSVSAATTVAVLEPVSAPSVYCGTTTDDSIQILWDEVEGATGYEVRVDGADWMAAEGPLSHTVTGLAFSQTVDFEVRPQAPCTGLTASLTCTTADCTPPAVDILVRDASCQGRRDGRVDIIAQTGQGPYLFSVAGDANATGTFENLSPGIYVAAVTDANGCRSTYGFRVNAPQVMDLIPVILGNINCSGMAQGALTAEVQGGTPPYAFNWDNAQSDSIATGLTAGPHFLTITDAGGCQASRMIPLTEPGSLTLTSFGQQVSCAGASDGKAWVDISGGTAPYSLQWSPSAGVQAGDSLLALPGGIYGVTVTDANGCRLNGEIQVVENPPLALNAQAVDVSCPGATDGKLLVSVSGGAGIYSYSWIDPATGSALGFTPALDALPSGDYLILLSDLDNCRDSAFVTIREPGPLQLDVAVISPSCTGGDDGGAILMIQGGLNPYNIEWSDGVTGQTKRNDFPSGPYIVEVTDRNGCAESLAFEVPDVDGMGVSFQVDSVRCFGGNDGTALAQVSNGSGMLSYEWSDGQQTPTAFNLGAGSISVTVTDAKGCQVKGTVEVSQPDSLQISVEGVMPLCAGLRNGRLDALVAGGTEPYAYQWSNGPGTFRNEGLAAGLYSLTVTDARGCQSETSVDLGEPSPLMGGTVNSNAGCGPDPDGVAIANVQGGTAPYSFRWNDPVAQQGDTAIGLNPGNYLVTVTDANGCTLVLPSLIEGPPPILLDYQARQVSCAGGADGAVTIQASGGTGPFSFSWDPVIIPPGGEATALKAGTYRVTVSDELGCSSDLVVELHEPEPLVVAPSIVSALCEGDETGSISLSLQGGTPPYAYQWNTGAVTPDLSGLSTGSYSVTVTDANSCRDSLVAEITQPNPLQISFAVEEVKCFGEASGSVVPVIMGGEAPYSFQWSTGTQAHSLRDLSAGQYELTITDASGCVYKRSVLVKEPSASLQADIRITGVSCFKGQDGRVTLAGTGGTPPYTYLLDGAPVSSSGTRIGLAAGTYQATVQDANGCLYQTPLIGIEEPELLEVDLGGNRTISYGDTLALGPVQVYGGNSGGISYHWTPRDTGLISCFDCPDPVITVYRQTSFKLVVTDEKGCTGEDILTVFVTKDDPVFVPTGFTPNGDGHNDLLLVHGRKESKTRVISFRIFDRWGEMIFQDGGFLLNDPGRGWDGYFRGEPLNAGVFLWQLVVEREDGTTESFSGSSTLIR